MICANFCPVREINRSHSGLCEGFIDADRAKKMRHDGGAEFIRAFDTI